MLKKNTQNDLLDEINEENARLDEFLSKMNSQIKKTDGKFAKAIMDNDIKTVKLYKSILQD